MDKIILNDKELTEEEFNEEKKKIEESKGVKVVEVDKKVYKTRIQE